MEFIEVARLRQALQECRSFENFCSTVQSAFRDLVQSGRVERALNQDLERLAGIGEAESARDFLFDDGLGRLQLAIGLLEPSHLLEGLSSHRLVGVLRGHVLLKRYRQPTFHDPSILDSSSKLEALADRQLSQGEVYAAEAWWDVAEPHGDALILVLSSGIVYPTQWLYDRMTLTPVALVPGNRALARIQDTLQLLGFVGSAEHADVCFRLAEHPAHAIRWQAIKTAFALGHPNAMTLLERALNDPHPEIKEAATEALRQWS